MKNHEEKIEQFLKNRMSSVHPSRTLFEETLNHVTNTSVHRITTEKAGIPSPYQLINNFIMKKIALIGFPVIVLAIVAIVTIKKPIIDTKVVYEESTSSQITNQGVANTGVLTEITSQGNVSSDTSIDSIIASFNADAEADATLASSETQDDADLLTQLQDYNNIKTTDYENNL